MGDDVPSEAWNATLAAVGEPAVCNSSASSAASAEPSPMASTSGCNSVVVGMPKMLSGAPKLALTNPWGVWLVEASAMSALAAQPWPGNLAELHRVVRTVATARTAGDIIPGDLPAEYRSGPRPGSPLRQAEREVIVAAIEAAGGNKVKAARALGVSRATIYNRMRALGIS